ncbi:siderophore ABC transporter substrate-binding protein [Paenibacillus nasutitermitis]|uniref:ABC transporter solute-binding protein YclQ n=1 Tax=Paenibacillus nasutitermitis TaxID=1652958 RepID=A0A916ZA62_9BACL|nr:siderophore ABC transporter substrate-binding protein [Paenibacillus nasutitermitis]GGD83957.1 putative ABC transporter solute-binding protein YclQ [Paenibacillus nasutitermitis]
MKKASLFILVFMMAIVMAACGSTNKEGNTNTSSGAGGAVNTSADTGAEGNGGGNAEPAPTEEMELTIEHKLGSTVVKKNPQKVVVFDFGVLDTLDKLGVEVAGLPQANIPSYLSKYEDSKYANAGGLKEPDFEKINAIGPDLIIISGRQSDAYDELSKIGPTIFLGVDTAKYMDSYKQNAETIGRIFGKETQVQDELAKVEASIAALHEKVTANGKKALVILANEGAISAYGQGSRFGIIHDVFGFTPVDPNIEVSTHGQTISYEYIAEKNPDYLYVVDRGTVVDGQSTSKSSLENDLVKKTNAYKNGNIVYLNADFWYLSGGGLISVEEMVKEVDASLK